MTFRGGKYAYAMGNEGPLADWWLYEDRAIPQTRLSACAGFAPEEVQVVPMTYDEMRPGCYEQRPRLDDMDLNWVEASLCFPTFPRFCGQTFLEADDKDLALLCVQAYNDWMVEEWCAGIGRAAGPAVPHPAVGRRPRGRRGAAQRGARRAGGLLLRDAAEPRAAVDPRRRPVLGPVRRRVRRDRHRDLHAQRLGLEDAVDVARRAAGGVVDAHPRARRGLAGRLAVLGPARALSRRDAHVLRGPDRLDPLHPRARRSRVGAQPRLEPTRATLVPEPPSTYYWGRIYGCFFDDAAGLARDRRDRRRPGDVRDRLPARRRHVAAQQGRWPRSCSPTSTTDLVHKIVRGNAIELFGISQS